MPTLPVTLPPTRTTPVILIGGGGFLGRAYSARLRRVGRAVHLVGRADWDSGRADALACSLAGCDPEIVDFAYATVPSTSFADPVGDFTVNLGAMIRHLEFSRRVGSARHVFLSSGGTVYGDQANRPLTENSPTRPISPYGITKLASEHYAEMYRRLGVPTLIVRPSNIFGPGQTPFRGQGLVATAFGAALKQRPLTVYGDGSQQRDYLFVEDFCTGLDVVLDQGQVGEIYNLGNGVATSTNDLLTAIAEYTARDSYPLTIAVEPSRQFDVGCNQLDTTRLRQLGWRPHVSLDDGLQQTWQWILSLNNTD